MEAPVAHTYERRRAQRKSASEEHGLSSVRIRSGPPALLVDASTGGLLLETEGRLLPGAVIEMSLETSAQRTTMRGRVLRSSVASVLSGAVSYRSAIVFDRPLAILADNAPGYFVPAAEARKSRWVRADATPATETRRTSHVG